MHLLANNFISIETLIMRFSVHPYVTLAFKIPICVFFMIERLMCADHCDTCFSLVWKTILIYRTSNWWYSAHNLAVSLVAEEYFFSALQIVETESLLKPILSADEVPGKTCIWWLVNTSPHTHTKKKKGCVGGGGGAGVISCLVIDRVWNVLM